MADIEIQSARNPFGPEWASLTFPKYRARLDRVPGATGLFASTAEIDGRPAGLALAQRSGDQSDEAELLSIYIVTKSRNQGLGTALLAALESDLAAANVRRLVGTYMTSIGSVDALERVLQKRAFSPPVLRKIAVRFTPEEPARAPWYQLAKVPAGGEIFAWSELSSDEDAALRRSQAETPWIPADLEPWRCDPNFDRVSSVGLRKDGGIAGWVINHRMTPDLVAFTVSFMRPDLARRGAIFALYVASLQRLQGTGVTCTYVTDASFESMSRFTLRRVAPYVSFCGETRGVVKDLVSAP